MSDESNEPQTSQIEPLIYTNWRGKTFVIDQAFVEDLKQWCEADGLDAGNAYERAAHNGKPRTKKSARRNVGAGD